MKKYHKNTRVWYEAPNFIFYCVLKVLVHNDIQVKLPKGGI